MSTFSGGPNIVTDGLILYLDAGNTKSYPGFGTTWTDISRSRFNGTLTNGPTFNTGSGGSIVFDGVDDLVSVNNNAALNSNIGTVSVWFKANSITGYHSLIGKHDSAFSLNGFNLFVYTSGPVISGQIKGASTTTNLPSMLISTNIWYNYTVSFSSGDSYSSYMNGILLGTGSLVSFTVSSQPLRIGSSVDSFWQTFNGNIAQALLYNRALTATEVLQNYNTTRGRFGI